MKDARDQPALMYNGSESMYKTRTGTTWLSELIFGQIRVSGHEITPSRRPEHAPTPRRRKARSPRKMHHGQRPTGARAFFWGLYILRYTFRPAIRPRATDA